MGLEFRDSAYILSAKNSRKIKSGMIFNLTLGFQDLEEGGKKYESWLISLDAFSFLSTDIHYILWIPYKSPLIKPPP